MVATLRAPEVMGVEEPGLALRRDEMLSFCYVLFFICNKICFVVGLSCFRFVNTIMAYGQYLWHFAFLISIWSG